MEELEREILAFRHQVHSVQEDRDLLLQLVQIGLGQNIWTSVLEGTEANRFEQAFELVQRIFLQATRVRGREPLAHLNVITLALHNFIFQDLEICARRQGGAPPAVTSSPGETMHESAPPVLPAALGEVTPGDGGEDRR